MPSLVLQPGSPPSDQAFPPAGWQVLINTVAAYLSVSGLESLEGVIISELEPAAADRDKVWVKRDEVSNLAVGLFVYNGGWLPIPVVAQSGDAEPGSPKSGQLFYDASLKGLKIYDGSQWTYRMFPAGTTLQRPASAPVGSYFFDATIGRLLIMSGSGWTTADGGVGDVKMVDFSSELAATTANPGWSVFRAMDKRFPLGAGSDLAAQQDGGNLLENTNFKWDAKGRSASGGSREASASFIGELTIAGAAARADGSKLDALTALGGVNTVSTTPPYRTIIFLRKDF